ncbi:hypothetical protein MM236_11560 [Belliella sp. DSM 107340]|uniref:Uncharacterized protein n=1 Tax=Belliella calami TaxID=2923436 RepID=A0ABS9UQW1_9BACT|nr:hypothetical protein [Belliella calami]MCH7398633.1 hypothetical protein [Belliella calami]
MKVAIVTRPQNGSPKILANCLQTMLSKLGHDSDTFKNIASFRRLSNFKEVDFKYGRFLWNIHKLFHKIEDQLFFSKLSKFDVIVFSETIPTMFMRNQYNIEKIKKITKKKPLLLYEVYYIGNAPTVIQYLKENNDNNEEIFDWHFSVSSTTEIKQLPQKPWSQIGLYLEGANLKPVKKEKLLAVIDFEREDFIETREMQIRVLNELQIPYICLEGKYEIEEIRNIYRKSTFYFMQSNESFGLPIAECLSCGSLIFTEDNSWPMAWRLDERPTIHGPGILPECFVEYKNEEKLKEKLKEIIENYDLNKTPFNVFDVFYKNYPTFYSGNLKALDESIKIISRRN